MYGVGLGQGDRIGLCENGDISRGKGQGDQMIGAMYELEGDEGDRIGRATSQPIGK